MSGERSGRKQDDHTDDEGQHRDADEWAAWYRENIEASGGVNRQPGATVRGTEHVPSSVASAVGPS